MSHILRNLWDGSCAFDSSIFVENEIPMRSFWAFEPRMYMRHIFQNFTSLSVVRYDGSCNCIYVYTGKYLQFSLRYQK